MLVFSAVNGQALMDVMLNTYGSFDLAIKLLQDNGISNLDYDIVGGEQFEWDETLTADQSVNTINSNSNIVYSTSIIKNATLSTIVQGNTGATPNNNGYYQPSNPNPATMIKYENVQPFEYVASGGETSITLTQLIGASIVQIIREIKPMAPSDFSFNVNTGQITFNNGISLTQGETLAGIYTKIVTS